VLHDLVISTGELVELDDAVAVEVELLEELVNEVAVAVDLGLDVRALGGVLDGVLDEVGDEEVELVEVEEVVLVLVVVRPEVLELLVGEDDDTVLLVGLGDDALDLLVVVVVLVGSPIATLCSSRSTFNLSSTQSMVTIEPGGRTRLPAGKSPCLKVFAPPASLFWTNLFPIKCWYLALSAILSLSFPFCFQIRWR